MRAQPAPPAHHRAGFRRPPRIEVDSAGLNDDADVVCSAEHIAWAGLVFVMEKAHKAKLARRFGRHMKRAWVVCLDIPDD